MNPMWLVAFLTLFAPATGLPEDQFKSFITLTKYAYEDACSNAAKSEFAFVNEPSDENRELWEKAMIEYAYNKIDQFNETSNQEIEPIRDGTLQYAYNVVMNPGDALLETDDYDLLISFSSRAELSRLTAIYGTENERRTRQDATRHLARNVDPKEKLLTWTAWHRTLFPLAANFSNVIQLVEKAANANDRSGIRKYWEMLSGYNNGYERAQREWEKMSLMYEKISNFVKKRLNLKYNDKIENDALPSHVLGSLRGDEWTNLVMDVTQYSEAMFIIQKNLWEKKMVGKNLYKEASKLGQVLFKQGPRDNFWRESNFTGQCPSRLISLCREGEMRISTCNEASIGNFISAHKNVARILASQMSHDVEPILNVANRYSALEEGVSELFGILAMSPAWLEARGLIDKGMDMDDARVLSLTITALDILPRMAYYLAADTWRIEAVENNALDENNLTSGWWSNRMTYQKIGTSLSDLPTFLDDEHVTGNRPYLSKFLGALLGFQIYEYLMDSTEVRYEPIDSNSNVRRLIKMMSRGFADDWTQAMKKYLNLDTVNADPLLTYFSALIDHIDEQEEMDESFPIPEGRENDLDDIANEYREKINAPPMTSGPSTALPVPEPIESKSMRKPDNERGVEPAKPQTSGKARENASPENIEVFLANRTGGISIEMESVESERAESDTKKPGGSAKKAVWAVGAVLIATVVVSTIAIFGRIRCRKAPKNRRYV